MSVKVLIAHDDEEEAKAEELAGPIREAGYEVVHGGTVLVGESVPVEFSKQIGAGGPVVLCGTVQAIGSGWARRLAQATRAYNGVRLFIVQMEKKADVDSVAFEGEKIARYWQDPAKALHDLVDALHQHFPLRPEPSAARASVSSALHQLKPPPEHFTGRAEPLAELCAALRPHPSPLPEGEGANTRNAVVISAVNGMGGVGKTALAIMAGHAVLDDFPDMQLFLELRAHSPQPVSAEQARDSVLQAAHPKARLPNDDTARWRLYSQLFHGKQALVILDDAADDEQVRLLSPPPGCALLVTSRRRLRTGRPLHLDRLPRAEAAALLRAHAPRLADAEAERLAQLCGDLPVALKTAGGFLKAYSSMPVAEYLAELENNRLDGLRNDDDPLDDVNRVFEASYRALSEAERRAFAALSVMSADFDRGAGKAVIESTRAEDAPAAGKLLDRLVHLNLLDYKETGGRYGWHDLLRDYAAARLLPDEAERARVGHAEYFIGIGEQTDKLYLQGNDYMLQGLALFDQERAHLEAAFGFLADNPDHDERLIRLVDSTVYTGSLRFSPRLRIHRLEAQAVAAHRMGNRVTEGNALGNLGIAYYSLGELRKAIDYHERHLAIACNIGDQHGKGNALGNLGTAYRNLGKPLKAIECYEQQLAIVRKIGYRRGEGNALGGLGNTYTDLSELRKAIEYHEQALAIRRDIGDRQGEGIALSNLGDVYTDLNEPRKSIEYYEQALVIARDIGDQSGEGSILGNMGIAYADLGKPHKAINYYEQALTVCRDIGSRYSEGRILGNLGNTYRNLGEPRKAIEYHEQALAIRRDIGDRRGEGSVLGNLGNDHTDLGDLRKAIKYHEQYLAIARDIGNRHGEGKALSCLGVVYKNLGKPHKAVEYHKQALVIARDIGDQRGEGNALGNLGVAYRHLGDLHKAIEYHEQAFVIARNIGDRHIEKNAFDNLGIAYRHLGEPRRAIEYHKQAFVIARDIGDRRGEGNSLWNSALAHKTLGKRIKALSRAEQALAIYEAIEDPNAAKVQARLAEWRDGS